MEQALGLGAGAPQVQVVDPRLAAGRGDAYRAGVQRLEAAELMGDDDDFR